ncbi:MAG: minC [Rhizobiaceae bacterium]|nr:minC [Rhizobiaceae bacterium]
MDSVAFVKTDSAALAQKKSIRFPARSFLAFALAPEAPLGEWLECLDQWTENSPGFFLGRPVVLDLNLLQPQASEVKALVGELAARGIRIYAIESRDLVSLGPDLPPLLKGARASSVVHEPHAPADPAIAPETRVEDVAVSAALIIDSPIRSGQSIYHPHGDVVVLGSVASGAEILAGGSIHVYGTLRGRAFAGATGNQYARIFCRKNEAELLAVDGWYRTAEDMESSTYGKPVQAFLDNGVVWVAALN